MPILSLDLLTIGLIGMSFDKTSWGYHLSCTSFFLF